MNSKELWESDRLIAKETVPAEIFDKLTESSSQGLTNAYRIALRNRTPAIGSEHILAGIMSVEGSIVSGIFEKLGIDRERLNENLNEHIALKSEKDQFRLNESAVRVFQLAVESAARNNDYAIASYHLLLGILEGGGEGAKFLEEQGVSSNLVKQTVSDALRRPVGPLNLEIK